MAATDVSPVVARIVNRINSVASIGRVWPHDIYAHTDLRSMVVSKIDGVDRLRAWWITGPSMRSRLAVQAPGGWVERTWTYTIQAVEGLTETGSSIETLRANMLAVIDALDADPFLAGTVHRSEPCQISTPPQNRAAWAGIATSYMSITKTVVTLSTP
jgi:hypothetical protein